MYERWPDNQVFTVESILGKLPVVPVGDTGTIPSCMLQHAEVLSALHSVQEWGPATTGGGISIRGP